jgi:hypothetical protein
VRSFVAKTVPVFLGFYRDAAPMGLDSILIFGLQRCRADGAGEPAGIQTGELNSSVSIPLSYRFPIGLFPFRHTDFTRLSLAAGRIGFNLSV